MVQSTLFVQLDSYSSLCLNFTHVFANVFSTEGDAGFDARLKEFQPELKDHGSHPLKGIHQTIPAFESLTVQ
jgi:endonuclease IV